MVNKNVQRIFDEELEATIGELVALVSPEDAYHIQKIIEECSDEVERGSSEGGRGLPGDPLIMPVGVEDPEYCQRDDRNLQTQLCGVFDKSVRIKLRTPCFRNVIGMHGGEFVSFVILVFHTTGFGH